MSIQEKVSELDTCIKEYLWSLAENRGKNDSFNGKILSSLRELANCDFAFLLRRGTNKEIFSFEECNTSIDGLEFEGIDFPVSSDHLRALSKAVSSGGIGVEPLSFLGEDFAVPTIYCAVNVGGQIRALVGMMDFGNPERLWSGEEKELVFKAGRALGLYVEYTFLLESKKQQASEFKQRVDNESKLRNKVEAALVKAEKANKAKQKFLVNMSHDIRTPMNAIIGFAALANTHVEEHDRVKDYLGKITSSSKSLLSLFNDVLDITNIEEGRAQLDEMPNTLSTVVHDIKKMIQGMVDSKLIKLSMETVDVVHEKIFCDQTRLNQIMLNLISNSIKHTNVGGKITVTVKEITSRKDGYGSFDFIIKDDGMGMSEEYVAHIFDPFEKEENTSKSVLQGTGLTMAITKNLIDMMQGDIRISSQVGVGSEVVISLDFKLQNESNVSGEFDILPEIEGKRAFIVNSSIDTCNSLIAILKRFGATAEWTLSANEAIQRAKMANSDEADYDVFFIDWHMSDMNGVEIIRQLRRFVDDEIPMVLITDGNCSDFVDEVVDLGTLGFLSKPIFASDVKSLISSTMNGPSDKFEAPSIVKEADFIGRRILLAEDNKMNQEIAITILEDAGFFVDLAEDGEIAVNKIINHPGGYYDLVLMDIKMPVMDGYEATKRIRGMSDESKKDVPIIAMTADAFSADRQLALECGMNEHITKPVDIDRLFSVLKSVVK